MGVEVGRRDQSRSLKIHLLVGKLVKRNLLLWFSFLVFVGERFYKLGLRFLLTSSFSFFISMQFSSGSLSKTGSPITAVPHFQVPEFYSFLSCRLKPIILSSLSSGRFIDIKGKLISKKQKKW